MNPNAMRIKTLAFGLCVIISGMGGLLPRLWASPLATTKASAVLHVSNPFAGIPVLANTELDPARSDPDLAGGPTEEIRVRGYRMPRPMPIKLSFPSVSSTMVIPRLTFRFGPGKQFW